MPRTSNPISPPPSRSCTTDDWLPRDSPADGVTLAPLSSPKPTQFRFYGSPDPATGMPMTPGKVQKNDGYAHGSGLRGRKVYRWRQEPAEYWEPTIDERAAEGRNADREYLALDEQRDQTTQLTRHRGWVRPGVTFQVTLFLDGVPEPELSALLWLINQGETAPLRLGAGKPFGFGVLAAHLDHEHTHLWDGAGVRAGWLGLARPKPAGSGRLTALTEQFAALAKGNLVLREDFPKPIPSISIQAVRCDRK